MTKSYRVFTGAPPADIMGKTGTTSWQTASSREITPPLPPMTIEQACHNISLLYQDIAFEEDEEEKDYSEEWESEDAKEWPPTNPAEASNLILLKSRDDMSFFQETFETDQTGDDTTHSEGSSISHFPTFNFSMNALVSLSFILQASRPGTSPSKVTLLLGVLEVDGPNYVTIKTGPHSGSEVGLLKIIVGDERGAVSKIVAWRETADVWGGNADEPALKRGDIVLFENVLVSSAPPAPEERRDSDSKVQITASPHLKSQAHICYRTLPHTYEDKTLRPDLRLGDSVPAVRKVGEVVTWMEQMAGIRTNL